MKQEQFAANWLASWHFVNLSGSLDKQETGHWLRPLVVSQVPQTLTAQNRESTVIV